MRGEPNEEGVFQNDFYSSIRNAIHLAQDAKLESELIHSITFQLVLISFIGFLIASGVEVPVQMSLVVLQMTCRIHDSFAVLINIILTKIPREIIGENSWIKVLENIIEQHRVHVPTEPKGWYSALSRNNFEAYRYMNTLLGSTRPDTYNAQPCLHLIKLSEEGEQCFKHPLIDIFVQVLKKYTLKDKNICLKPQYSKIESIFVLTLSEISSLLKMAEEH